MSGLDRCAGASLGIGDGLKWGGGQCSEGIEPDPRHVPDLDSG